MISYLYHNQGIIGYDYKNTDLNWYMKIVLWESTLVFIRRFPKKTFLKVVELDIVQILYLKRVNSNFLYEY